jgi:hypothetical protein
MKFECIPAPLEVARFRKSEQFIIKTHFIIKGYSGEFAPAFYKKLHQCIVLKSKLSLFIPVPLGYV